MKNPCLLSLAPLLLLLAVSSSLPPTVTAAVRLRTSVTSLVFPAGAGQSPAVVECIGDGVYAANSTYQANLRRLTALLAAEASATPVGSYPYAERVVGYWPNRLLGTYSCSRRRNEDGGGDPCADCLAGAFLEVERACPYRRVASFSDGNCTLQLEEIRIFGTGGIFFEGDILKQLMASGLVFQAIGFACLFFLQFQEWRSRKRGSLMNSAPVLSGD